MKLTMNLCSNMSVKSHNLNLVNGGSVAKLNEIINAIKCGKKQQLKFLEI